MATETTGSGEDNQVPPGGSSSTEKMTSAPHRDVVRPSTGDPVGSMSPALGASGLSRKTPSKVFVVEDVLLDESPESAAGASNVDSLSVGESLQGSNMKKVHFSLMNGAEADRNGSASDGPSDWSEDERPALSDKVSTTSEDEGIEKESSPSISRSSKEVTTLVQVDKKIKTSSPESDKDTGTAGGVALEKEVSTSSTVTGEEVPSLEEESEGGSVRGVTGGGGEEFKQQQQQVPALISTEPPKREDPVVAYSPDKRFLKYDIEIGRGSFKTVYKALDTETGVAVAWCELQENRYNKSEQLRFKDEVKILKTLQHPNILRLYESWESTQRGDKKDRKVLVLVTELMTSGTLKGYMRRLKAIKPKVIRSWGRQILRGLHFLHTRTPPIIHRDLKCDNIFINGTTGLVKIGDLGLATLKRSDVKTVIGTPEFMAPEMYEENYDESVDVYAFGMCLLEMCTQEYPYMECSNPAQIYKRVTQGVKPNALEKVKNEVLLSIIANCTIVNKKSRYNVKMLLSHEFFAEGVKIEPLKGLGNDAPVLDLKMEVPTKETSKKNNQESIEFSFDLEKDTAEGVVSAMVKSSLLRADEQIKQNCVRSLRDYVDTVKQKRRQVNKDKEEKSSSQQLSSGSESNIGDSEQLSGPPKLQHQLSSNEGSPQAGQETSANGKNGGGGVANGSDLIARERTDSVVLSSGTTNGHHGSKATPFDKASHSKCEVQPASGVVGGDSASQAHVRTLSESSSLASTSQQHLDAPSKSTTAPNMSNPAPANGGSSGESEDRRSYASAVSSSKPPKYPTHSSSSAKATSASSSQTPGPEQSGKVSLNSPSILSNGTSLADETSSSLALIHTEVVPVHAMVTSGGGGGGLEASSTSSLNQDSGTERGSDREKHSESGSLTERQASANGKKRASRSKRQLKLDFQELATNNVVKCTLNTSAGQSVDFRFSLEYDKPSAIFKQLEKAGHLAATEEDNFLRQINQLLHSVKKKDRPQTSISSAMSSSSSSETRTHSSSVSVLDDSQGSKSMPSLSCEHPPVSPTPPLSVGVSEDMMRKSSLQHDTGMLMRDTPTRGMVDIKDTPLSILEEGVSTSLASGSTSDLVISSYQPSQNQDAVSGAGSVIQPTSTGPSTTTQPPSAAQPPSTSTSRSVKKFEVAEVDEPPESPPPSDISAQSSTDNVAKDIGGLHASELETHPPGGSGLHIPSSYGPRHFPLNIHPQNLDSFSESQLHSGQGIHGYSLPFIPPMHVGGADIARGHYSCTPEPAGDYPFSLYHPFMAGSRHVPVTTAASVHSSGLPHYMSHDPRLPHPLPQSQTNISRHPSVPNMPSLTSLQQHQQGGGAEPVHHHTYHGASGVCDHQYPSILPEYNPYHPQAAPPTTSSGPSNNVSSQLRPHPFPSTTHASATSYPPRPQGAQNLPGFSDVPQPDLLAKAFMVFLHAMGGVFRNPAFEPLLESLENNFGPFGSAPSSTSHHSAAGRSESGLQMRQGSYSPPPLDPHQHQQNEDRPTMCHTPDKTMREEVVLPGQTHRISKATPPCVTPEKHGPDDVEDKNRSYYEQQMRILDEEMRDIESRKQQIMEQYLMKRGSDGSSLDGSGHLASKKSSLDSVLGSPVQHHGTSPSLQSTRLADLQEKDKVGPGVAAPQSCRDPLPDDATIEAPHSRSGPSPNDAAPRSRHGPPPDGAPTTESNGNAWLE